MPEKPLSELPGGEAPVRGVCELGSGVEVLGEGGGEMICANCCKANYVPAKTDLVNIGVKDLDCHYCPKCGEIIFTHEQSLRIDEKRRKG